MKTCKRCNTEKPLDAFYVHSQMADGHLNICKECVKARVAIYDKQPHVKERDRIRRRGGRDQKHVARMRAYRKNNSQRIKEYKAGYFREQRKRKANYAISNGLRDGKIIRPNKCEKCGKQCQPQAHHPNYDEPLNVQWLCSKCHGQAHWKQVSA
jgi:hypothetical protein